MRRRRRSHHEGETTLFSPLLDVLMNCLGAILMLLVVYIFFFRDDPRPPPPPCVLVLSEKDLVFRFDSGKAEISSEFRKEFESRILPRITERATLCDGEVLEVVGHTDAQPLQAVSSNLDRESLEAYKSGSAAGLVAGSNVDLGFMRAIAIVGLLKELQAEGRLPGIRLLLPLSAGPAVLPDQRPGYEGSSEPDAERRRIEIRVVRASAWNIGNGSDP